MNETPVNMSDILIVHQFKNMIINVFGMHFDFIILHVSIGLRTVRLDGDGRLPNGW